MNERLTIQNIGDIELKIISTFHNYSKIAFFDCSVPMVNILWPVPS